MASRLLRSNWAPLTARGPAIATPAALLVSKPATRAYSSLLAKQTSSYNAAGISPSQRLFAARSFATSTSDAAALSAIKNDCRKVMCIGRNFADHVKELNNQRPKQPFFFLKPPSSILLPNEGPILQPRGVNLHYEVELGIVIGKTVRDLDEQDEAGWRDAIESYVLAIDMTGRNVQDEAKKKGLPWSIAKGFDTFLPIAGPIAKSKVTDPHNLELWLSVNGKMKQQDSTELMLFRIGRQLSDISKVMTLGKGDIVLTGTPKGVGQVVPGDVIEAGIRIDGKDVSEARISVDVKGREGPYEFAET